MKLNLPKLHCFWFVEYGQTSPKVNKLPNLWPANNKYLSLLYFWYLLRSFEWKDRKRCCLWPSWLYLRWTLRLVWCRKDLEQWSQMYFFFLVWIFSCLSKSDLKTKLFGQKAQFSKGLCSNRPPTWSSELLLLKQKSQSFNLSREEKVFCYQNCSDLL